MALSGASAKPYTPRSPLFLTGNNPLVRRREAKDCGAAAALPSIGGVLRDIKIDRCSSRRSFFSGRMAPRYCNAKLSPQAPRRRRERPILRPLHHRQLGFQTRPAVVLHYVQTLCYISTEWCKVRRRSAVPAVNGDTDVVAAVHRAGFEPGASTTQQNDAMQQAGRLLHTCVLA